MKTLCLNNNIQTSVEAGAVYLLFSTLFIFIVFNASNVFTDDGFYHYRIAKLMTIHGPKIDIDSLPYTILGEHGVDHHWLWHVLISPIAFLFNDDYPGLKVAIALTGAMVPCAIFIFAKNFRIPYPWAITILGVFAIADLPGRYLLLCAQNIALCLLLAYIIFLNRKNYIACGITSYIFMLSYHGAIMLAPISIIASVLAISFFKKVDTKILYVTAFGLFLGLLVNPWFPKTFEYIYFHIAHKMLTHTNMAVGQEWDKINFFDSISVAWLAHLSLFISIVALAIKSQDKSLEEVIAPETGLFIFLSIAFLVSYLFASRFSEYYGPSSVITGGLVLRDLGGQLPLFRKRIIMFAIIVIILFKIPVSVRELAEGGSYDGKKYAEVDAYLKEHANKGDIVFNLRWDDFVFLFWDNPQLRYVNGLDPNFLAYGSPDKYEVWSVYALAKLPNAPSHAQNIKRIFGARWVVMDLLYEPLIDQLVKDSHAKLVVAGKRTLLFQLED